MTPRRKTPGKVLTLGESGRLLWTFFTQPHTVQEAVDKFHLTPGRVNQHIRYSRGVQKYAVTHQKGRVQILVKEEHKNSSKKSAKKSGR